MKRTFPAWYIAAGVSILVGLCAAPASAAYLTSWGSALTPSDPNGDSVNALYTEITDVYFNQDASYYYFRIDVAADVTDPLNSWSYMVWVDSDNNTGTGSQETGAEDSPYLDDTLDGIDNTFALHYALGFNTGDHWHPYSAVSPWVTTTDFTDAGGFFQYSENGNTSLEWQVPKSMLGTGPMTWYAGVHELALDSTADWTPAGYALNDGPVVPEPTSFLLFSVVAGVGYTLKRKKHCKAAE